MRGLSKLYRVAINAFLPVDQRNLLLPVHTYLDIFQSAIFSFRMWLSSTRIRWIRHTNPQLFESALQNGNFWIRYESGIAKVSCTVNIVFKMATLTHAQYPILPEESWVTEIIRIYVGYAWTSKFDLNADTCGKTKGRKKWEI